MRKTALLIALASATWFATAALAEEGAAAKPAKPPAAAAAPAAPHVEKLPEIVPLTEKDVKGFIDASTKLRKLGIQEQVEQSGGNEPTSMADALSRSKDAVKIIGEHGFTTDRFESVAYNIGMALAADEMKKKPEELAAAKAKQEQALAQMKDKLTPEQYAQMEQRMKLAGKMMDQLQKLPPANIELVRQYATQLHSAVGDEGPPGTPGQ